MGDLDRAERELEEAVDLHRDIDAPAGEAHSLQRLAEVRLAQGDRAEAERLLQRALPLARWSMMSKHLLQRIYGTMITAAPDPRSARAVVDQAEATLAGTDSCLFCDVMLAVPAAIACAAVGDLEDARRHLCGGRAVGRAVGGHRLAGRRTGGAGTRGTSRGRPGAGRPPRGGGGGAVRDRRARGRRRPLPRPVRRPRRFRARAAVSTRGQVAVAPCVLPRRRCDCEDGAWPARSTAQE